jgi:hypothetical protein
MDNTMDGKNTINLQNEDKEPEIQDLTLKSKNSNRLLAPKVRMHVVSPKSYSDSSSECDSGYVMGLPLNAEDNDIIKDELKHMECDMAWIAAEKESGNNQPWKNTDGAQIDYSNWASADGETNSNQYAALDTNGKWHKKSDSDKLNCAICL